MTADQQTLLERVASTYRRNSVQDGMVRRSCVRAFDPWLNPEGAGLEVGCSDGLLTQLLAERLKTLDVVEATETFIQEARQRALPNVTLHHSMIEGFRTTKRFDAIFLTWILTHLVDPQVVLAHLRGLLAPGGLLFVVVPNVRVLSRQLALHMGLVPDLYALTDNDRNHGHQRAYDRKLLNRELDNAGFETIDQGGLMLKILADQQMDELFGKGILTDAHAEAFYSMGREYPEFASAIFSVCRPKP